MYYQITKSLLYFHEMCVVLFCMCFTQSSNLGGNTSKHLVIVNKPICDTGTYCFEIN